MRDFGRWVRNQAQQQQPEQPTEKAVENNKPPVFSPSYVATTSGYFGNKYHAVLTPSDVAAIAQTQTGTSYAASSAPALETCTGTITSTTIEEGSPVPTSKVVHNDPLPADFNRRIGKFSISHEFVQNSPLDVMAIMSQCIITAADYDMMMDEITYTARSVHFTPLAHECVCPFYTFILHRDETGKATVTGVC